MLDRVDPITYRGGHLQIIACAGAGKTDTISRRVAGLLAEGVSPEGIIAFTFTERAGAELKSRIDGQVREDPRLGPSMLDRISPMFVGTMHAYCMQMLQAQIPSLGSFDVMDPHKLVGLLSREYQALGIDECCGGWHRDNLDVFLRSIDVMDNECLDAESLPEGEFRTSYGLLRTTLERYRVLTYGQMIVRAVETLRSDAHARANVLSPLQHVVVDEYQDTNPAQEALMWELSDRGAGAHVTVVGDDDQAVYQWRGATIENILSFADRYPDVAVAELSANWRSQPPIVDLARSFIESRPTTRLKKSIRAARPLEGGGVSVWSAETTVDEAEEIASTVIRLHSEGFAWSEMAVLLRSVKSSSRTIIEAFERHGIPFCASGSSGLFFERDAQLLAQLYSWLADKPWKRTRWADEYQEVHLDALVEELSSSFDLDAQGTALARARLERWYEEAHDDAQEANLVRDYYGLLEVLGLAHWEAGLGSTLAARLGTLARFSSLLADFEHGTKRARLVFGQIRGGLRGGPRLYTKLHSYIQYYALTSYEGFSGEETLGYDAVDVATVHTAKGLQWSVVFVPALTADRFPSSQTGRARRYLVPSDLFDAARYLGSIEDEARLFYVAMTRARDGLYLSRFRRLNTTRRPSEFWSFVRQAEGEVEPPLAVIGLPQRRFNGQDSLPILSFSALAAFEACPRSYRYRSLIGFEPALASEIGFGKAVHHVLRRLADETLRLGRVPGPEETSEIIDCEFFLPFANKPAHAQMLESARRLIRGFIETHQADLERVWETERPFELHLDSAVVSGRADVILDCEEGRPGTMAIMDYKTGIPGDEPSDLHRRQLCVYAAAGRREGMAVRAAYLMDLKHGTQFEVEVDPASLSSSEAWVGDTVLRLEGSDFPATPSKDACSYCDVAPICGQSRA